MPRLNHSVPKYQRHRASGQAVVSIQGKDFYLGRYGSQASKLEYDRRLGEWMAAGRPQHPPSAPDSITVVQLIASFWTFVEKHYVKDGKATSEQDAIRAALRPLRELYGRTPAIEFGPLALKSIRNRMIENGLARSTINQQILRIRRMFKWATSEELLPVTVYQSLASVVGLRKGRGEARETTPKLPVSDEMVSSTLSHLPPVVADMARFQRLTGSRPSEVCLLRPCDLDRSEKVWTYRPSSHKTEHHGRERTIFIGPKAQAILLPYLLPDSQAFCFSPVDSERQRLSELRANRKSKVQPSQVNRRKIKSKRQPGQRYTQASYRRAVWRACELAYPAPDNVDPIAWRKSHRWSPNQLRHTAATEIRKRFGVEAAQVALGHSNCEVTQVYAERDNALASTIMQEIG
jgi:integrase